MNWEDDKNGMTESRVVSVKTIRLCKGFDYFIEYENCDYKIEDGRISIYILTEQRYTFEGTPSDFRNSHYSTAEIASYPANDYFLEVTKQPKITGNHEKEETS
jgi:hypothetical protein